MEITLAMALNLAVAACLMLHAFEPLVVRVQQWIANWFRSLPRLTVLPATV